MAGQIDTLTLATTTLANYSRKIVDNAFSYIFLPKFLRQKSNGTWDGGEPIQVPLMYAKNTTIKVISKRAKLDTTEQDILTNAKFYWSIIGGTISLNDFDLEVLNKGQGKLLDILKPQMQCAELSLADTLNSKLWTARATIEDPWGIPDMVDSADPSLANFGDIDRDSYTWWKSTETTKAADPDLLVSHINTLYNTLSNGPDHPDIGMCDQTQYERLEDLLGNKIQLDEKIADLGFQAIKLKGMSIVLDKSATAQTFYMLNTKYIDFKEDSNWNPKVTAFQDVVDQPTKVAKILWAGQLTCSNCARQGKLTNLSASY
jgi:hypothetical protein